MVDPLENQHMNIRLFMILDEQSASDQNILLFHRQAEWAKPDGTRLPCDPKELGWIDDEDQYEPKTIWRRFRIPFDKAEFYWLALEISGVGNFEDDESNEEYRQYLQEVEIAPIDEKPHFRKRKPRADVK
jgi:hypothetical protein